MGTRAGDMDPAIMVYVQKALGMTPEQADNLINKKSGLLGISGKSSDMRDIEELTESGNERAALALEMFCYRVKKYIGAYAAAMGGLDAIVFTGGIGENGPIIREKSTRGLEFMGVKLDTRKNDTAKRGEEADISAADSSARILVIPTNEERMIARDTVEVVTSKAAASV